MRKNKFSLNEDANKINVGSRVTIITDTGDRIKNYTVTKKVPYSQLPKQYKPVGDYYEVRNDNSGSQFHTTQIVSSDRIVKESVPAYSNERQRSSMTNLGNVINHKDGKVAGIDGVINLDPVMGGAYVDSVRRNKMVEDELDPVEKLIDKEAPLFGAKKQPKPKKPVDPKIELDESLFLEATGLKTLGDNTVEFIDDVFSALADVFFKWRDYTITENDLDSAYEYFTSHFFDDAYNGDDDLDESIKKNRKNKLNEVYYDNDKKQEFADFVTDTLYDAIDNLYVVANSEIKGLPEPPDGLSDTWKSRIPRLINSLVEVIADDYFSGISESLSRNKKRSINEDEEIKYTFDDIIDDDADISKEDRKKVFDSRKDDRPSFLNASKFDRLMMELTPDNYGNIRHANNGKFLKYANSDRYLIDDISVDFDDNGNTYILVKSDTEDHLNFAKIISDYYDAKYEIFAPGEAIGLGAQYPRDKYILRIRLTDDDLEGPWETKEQRKERRRAEKQKVENEYNV